jgi:hypothetical protein
MDIDVLIEILAANPPSILFALGFILLFFGYTTGNSGLTSAGWILIIIGVILQIIWIIAKYGSNLFKWL